MVVIYANLFQTFAQVYKAFGKGVVTLILLTFIPRFKPFNDMATINNFDLLIHILITFKLVSNQLKTGVNRNFTYTRLWFEG